MTGGKLHPSKGINENEKTSFTTEFKVELPT
ncbi:MAG: hypothetical protein ACJAY2_003364 [Pseudomonadales bacterium]|jgi:hypothetical protein